MIFLFSLIHNLLLTFWLLHKQLAAPLVGVWSNSHPWKVSYAVLSTVQPSYLSSLSHLSPLSPCTYVLRRPLSSLWCARTNPPPQGIRHSLGLLPFSVGETPAGRFWAKPLLVLLLPSFALPFSLFLSIPFLSCVEISYGLLHIAHSLTCLIHEMEPTAYISLGSDPVSSIFKLQWDLFRFLLGDH